MSSPRIALYGVGGALLVAYLAAANMPGDDAPAARARTAQPAASTDALATEVRAQAARLHDRMAQAPTPEPSPRNPFAFGLTPRPPRAASVRAATIEPDLPPPVAPGPALTLMGIAEESVIGGVRRTAVIGGDGDTLFMVTEGQPLGARYRVTKIGADAVELEDLLTHAYRRLALK